MNIMIMFPESSKRYMYYSPFAVSVGERVLVYVGSGSTKEVKVVETDVPRSRGTSGRIATIAGRA